MSLGDGGGLPFAPIVEALRRLPSLLAGGRGPGPPRHRGPPLARATAELGRLVPELGSSGGPEPVSSTVRMDAGPRSSRACSRCSTRLSERVPVVLLLEDLHWADGSTRDVTSFLARNARSERLLLVGTYRTDELHRRHPLRPWLSEMERLPRVERFELARFGRTEMGAQIAAILDHPAARRADRHASRDGARAIPSSSRNCWRRAPRTPATRCPRRSATSC